MTYDAILRFPPAIPPQVGHRAVGRIYGDTLTTGHHPFPDGTHVSTSGVQEITEDGIATTMSGTRYKLEPLGA